MATALVVPIHLDALCLPEDRDVAGPEADFTLLPHVGPDGRDHNAGLPYLSGAILSAPFDDRPFRLKAGVHLHWSLPDALTRLTQDENGRTRVVAVPNRWLVTRTRSGAIDAQWVVESDHVSDDNLSGTVYPRTEPPAPGMRPYRYLGRRIRLDQWPVGGGEYLPELTAVGHGDPVFAAFYPNCHSVFGCHDPDFTTPPQDVSYDVVGWYGTLAQDPVANPSAPLDEILDRFGWSVPSHSGPIARTICYAKLTFAPAGRTVNPLLVDADTGVYVGHSPTEALAASLGPTLDAGDPDGIENLLEAVAFAGDLESRASDLEVRLSEARHTATFDPIPGGLRWTVRRRDDNDGVTAEQKQAREAITLPESVADLLDEVNRAQRDYDDARDVLVSLRDRLFADWHKYLICVYPDDATRDGYPDPDEVAFFLDRQVTWIQAYDAATGVFPPTGQGTSRAHVLGGAIKNLVTALGAVNTAASAAKTAFTLERVPAPPWWRPREPVVLFTGPAATPTDRHGADGTLSCAVADVPEPASAAALAGVRAAVDGRFPAQAWRTDPWHPVLLQWEAEYFPVAVGDNLAADQRDYAPYFVVNGYDLPPGEADLVSSAMLLDKGANVYAGTTVLSSGARPVLSERILTYLAGAILPAYNAGHPPVTPDDFARAPEAVLAWYESRDDPQARLLSLIAAYRHLVAHEDGNLSQSLGGFNDALVMRRLVRQLPIADPVNFPAYQAFARRVADAAGDETRSAPQPLTDFNPIRAGAMRLLRLRLVDNFGLTHDVGTDPAGTTERLRVPGHPAWVALPPRLAQPARMRFHLLNATRDDEAGDLPGMSPVCGWLVPSDLDDTLAVHAADGTALGALGAVADGSRARWSPVPGSTGTGSTAADPGAIADPTLRAIVSRLREAGPDAVGDLLASLSDALASIDPENDTPAGALLTARPLAVVRAELDLQIKGLPAVHQDWNVFREDMRRYGRETNAVTEVLFPVRIGQPGRWGDGVAGLWLLDEEGRPTGDFRAQATLHQSIDLPPVRMVLLLDPRGRAHAVSGVLPVASAGLDAAQYAAALGAMELDVFTAPVLGDAGRLGLPVPDVPGRRWAWREKRGAAWTTADLDASALDAHFPADLTAREGWLTLRPGSTT
ncbi:hypothetical protein AB0C10_18700 [Microbispora amethystogenes]|uniref:hypothetical protein n=1 Tax=Microbispora amethystogenes TaxID=1427754 RepID=UPI0033CE9627